jgi:hypothetical protein
LAAPSQDASLQASTERTVTVAGTGDDFTPESAGIFRASGTAEDAQGDREDAPLPKPRSARTGSASASTLASAAH